MRLLCSEFEYCEVWCHDVGIGRARFRVSRIFVVPCVMTNIHLSFRHLRQGTLGQREKETKGFMRSALFECLQGEKVDLLPRVLDLARIVQVYS